MRIGRLESGIIRRIEPVYLPVNLTIENLEHWTVLGVVTNLQKVSKASAKTDAYADTVRSKDQSNSRVLCSCMTL